MFLLCSKPQSSIHFILIKTRIAGGWAKYNITWSFISSQNALPYSFFSFHSGLLALAQKSQHGSPSRLCFASAVSSPCSALLLIQVNLLHTSTEFLLKLILFSMEVSLSALFRSGLHLALPISIVFLIFL